MRLDDLHPVFQNALTAWQMLVGELGFTSDQTKCMFDPGTGRVSIVAVIPRGDGTFAVGGAAVGVWRNDGASGDEFAVAWEAAQDAFREAPAEERVAMVKSCTTTTRLTELIEALNQVGIIPPRLQPKKGALLQ